MNPSTTTELSNIYAWASFFVNYPGQTCFDDRDIQIDLYGDGNTRCMLISVYLSDTSSVEYYFCPMDDADATSGMAMIFDFLHSHAYSLTALLDWLESADFKETERGPAVVVNGLSISRRNFAQGA